MKRANLQLENDRQSPSNCSDQKILSTTNKHQSSMILTDQSNATFTETNNQPIQNKKKYYTNDMSHSWVIQWLQSISNQDLNSLKQFSSINNYHNHPMNSQTYSNNNSQTDRGVLSTNF